MLLTLVALSVLCAVPAQSDWKLVWSDEFNGSSIDRTKWGFEFGNGQGGWGNQELECYTDRPENAFVKDGVLRIVARKEQTSGFPYSSARMLTKGKFSKLYGRFEFRAKLPLGKGLWPALWLMPAAETYGGWPASGEIDIVEARGQEPGKVLGTPHFGGRWPAHEWSESNYVFPSGTIADFHIYAFEWEPGVMRWLVDGKVYATKRWWWSSKSQAKPPSADAYPWPAPFDKPFFIIINLAVGGNFLGSPDASTPFPAEMQIDYVRVYDKTTGYGAAAPPDRPK